MFTSGASARRRDPGGALWRAALAALVVVTGTTTASAAGAGGGAQQVAPAPDAETLRALTLRYAALIGEAGPDDPVALAGELILLLHELNGLDRDALGVRERIDHDILAWRLDLGIAAQMEPELTDYELALYGHTGERVNPEDLHDLGLREVARLHAAMQELIGRYDESASLRAFLDAARTDDRLYAGSRGELLAHARSSAARIRASLGELFHEVPRTGFQLVTPGDQDGPRFMAWYQGPGSGPGARGYVVLNPDPRQVPLFVLDALLLHEAEPGHHFQMAWTAENVDVPAWRRPITLTAYVEGWGLYAESLGAELNAFRHPMSEFGRLNLEMWRAIRLVVDTGLHAFDWTPERAAEYFAEHTALPREQIAVEVQRYARNPGQAVAYKLGEQHLLALRAEAEELLGPLFDVRDFHATVLEHGPVMPATLAEIVHDWIAAQQTAYD